MTDKKEKQRIYVELSDESRNIRGMHLELYMDKDFVEAHGGIDEVEKYVKANLLMLCGDLLVPGLKPDFTRINLLFSEEKLKVMKQASEKDISSLLN